MKTILVFSHEHNTFDKRKLLANPHPDFVKDTHKSVNDFIKFENEKSIKQFFMEDIDGLLEKYQPGEPKMKPDVLKQIAEIEASRNKMMMEEQAKGMGQIMMNQPGKEPVALTIPQIAELLRNQQDIILKYESRIRELEFMNQQLQGIIIENAKQVKSVAPAEQIPFFGPPAPSHSLNPVPSQFGIIDNIQPIYTQPSKTEPLFRINE